MSVAPGQTVRTPLGTGVVVEVRNGRDARVQLAARVVTFAIGDLRPAPEPARPRPRARPEPAPFEPPSERTSAAGGAVIDLHGLTVEQALEAMMAALDQALQSDASELRVIHGRRGTKIRHAVHARLRGLPFVRAYRLDPANEGVTVVQL